MTADDSASSLPPTSEWPNHPVFIRPEATTQISSNEETPYVPVGKVVDFCSPLFEGKILIRLKNVTPNTEDADLDQYAAYFEGKKRHYQVVVQGRFLLPEDEKKLTFADVYLGDVYQKPFVGVPKGVFMKLMCKFMNALNPGLIFDIAADKPKVMTLIGSCQRMAITPAGETPPDLLAASGIEEYASHSLGGKLASASWETRRKILTKPKHASQFPIHSDQVYTFEIFDHSMDFGTYHQHLLGHQIDLTQTLNGQPLAMCAMTKDMRPLYRFAIWHERVLVSDDAGADTKQEHDATAATKAATEK